VALGFTTFVEGFISFTTFHLPALRVATLEAHLFGFTLEIFLAEGFGAGFTKATLFLFRIFSISRPSFSPFLKAFRFPLLLQNSQTISLILDSLLILALEFAAAALLLL
jgi:hypothetical protein